jgi:CPA2 family monovalent cation:H+ antiporter-2
MSIIEKIRALNPQVHIIVRTKHVFDVGELYKSGADEVIPEEFETAIDLFEKVLSKRLVPRREINRLVAKIRDDHYGIFRDESDDSNQIFKELPNLEIVALKVREGSEVIGKTIGDIQFRKVYGVTLIAVLRGDKLIEHPDAKQCLQQNDIIYIMGRAEQIPEVFDVFGRDGA